VALHLQAEAFGQHASHVARYCAGKCNKQSCLNPSVPRSALVLVSNYGGRLQKQGERSFSKHNQKQMRARAGGHKASIQGRGDINGAEAHCIGNLFPCELFIVLGDADSLNHVLFFSS
jgi:hypothetical protein